MTGHVVTLEPSVRGVLWRVSLMFRGTPFCIERMVIAKTTNPGIRSLTIEGKAGSGDQQISFTAPFEILTSVLPRTEEWGESEQAGFFGLSSVFADRSMPFTVHTMVAGLPIIEEFREYGETFVARTVRRVVRFDGDYDFRKASRHFTASILVWETQEKASGRIVPWGWEWVPLQVLLD